jgi:hypothetical protein
MFQGGSIEQGAGIALPFDPVAHRGLGLGSGRNSIVAEIAQRRLTPKPAADSATPVITSVHLPSMNRTATWSWSATPMAGW